MIIGEDIICREGQILVDPSKRSRMDQSIKGHKKLMGVDPEGTKDMLREIIKNTYRTLMSRGMKGCFVYIQEEDLKEYLKERIK